MAATPSGYRMPPSAILFAVLVMALGIAYIVIAFLYLDGWWTILTGLLAALAIFLAFGFLYAVANWWARSEASARE